jgi:hypothetical protein
MPVNNIFQPWIWLAGAAVCYMRLPLILAQAAAGAPYGAAYAAGPRPSVGTSTNTNPYSSAWR